MRMFIIIPLAVSFLVSSEALIPAGASARFLPRATDRFWAYGTIRVLPTGCAIIAGKPTGLEPGGEPTLGAVGYVARLQVKPSRWDDWEDVDQAPFRQNPRCVPIVGRG